MDGKKEFDVNNHHNKFPCVQNELFLTFFMSILYITQKGACDVKVHTSCNDAVFWFREPTCVKTQKETT